MQITFTGIKCDNITCTYSDPHVKQADYPQWVNRPCPYCGQNLLTKFDYNLTRIITGTAKALNLFRWFNPFYFMLQGSKEVTTSVELPKRKSKKPPKFYVLVLLLYFAFLKITAVTFTFFHVPVLWWIVFAGLPSSALTLWVILKGSI